jgi:plastocyanin
MIASMDLDVLRATWNRSRARRFIGLHRAAVLLAVAVTGLSGCGGGARESSPPPAGPAVSGTQDAMVGGTSTINLTWDQQNNCVNFVPKNTSILLGDRVNFTTSIEGGVTVNVPAGLFSAGDTTISVSRGANEASPTARALGTYPLSSNPGACPSPEAGGGPSIVVDSGEGKSGP